MQQDRIAPNRRNNFREERLLTWNNELRSYSDLLPRAAGKHGASVLCQKMALLVEAVNILLSDIWSF